MEIQQYYCPQQHVLLLRDDSQIIDEDLDCGICEYWVRAPYYVCNLCKYYAHKSCAELPKQINHSFHPHHPLTLLSRRNYLCNSCSQQFNKALMFSCDQCNFDLDVECALMSNSTTASPKGEEHYSIQHSSHPHLLLLVDDSEINKDVEIECFACKLESSPSAGLYYGCKRCKYYLHKKCIDQLPLEIQHPIHPHLLSLRAMRLFDYKCRCSFCEKEEGHTLYFECTECNFMLCVQCGVNKVRLSVNCKEHEHPLRFVEKIYTELDQCNAYNCYRKLSLISNSNELFDVTTSSVFQCLECAFKIHLLCAPLPSTIKHKWHLHHLSLVDSFIQDDSGEYCCDVCETVRDPRIRVYCCDQCEYIAHVHCVISEIINVLKDDLRDHVKLKSVGEDLWTLPEEIENKGVQEKEQDSSLSTLRDLIPKLTSYELDWLRDHLYWDKDNKREEEVSERTTQLGPGDETINEVLQLSSFTESRFNSFIKYDFNSGFWERKLKIKSSDLALKIVKVEGHWIPFTLASVLKSLIHKYGDISRESDRSPAMKSIIYFLLCEVMKKIHTTLVIDITKDLLRDWYYYMEFARAWYFEVDFLEASLEQITRAFFRLQVSKLEVEIPIILQNKIAEYKAKITDYEAKLEACMQLHKPSLQQEFLKNSLNKSVNLKWKTAAELGFNVSRLD